MKKIICLIGILSALYAHAQVGINTTSPSTTFDVSKSSVATVADGVLVTRISGDELKAKDATYGANQHAALVYVTSVPNPVTTKTSTLRRPVSITMIIPSANG